MLGALSSAVALLSQHDHGGHGGSRSPGILGLGTTARRGEN